MKLQVHKAEKDDIYEDIARVPQVHRKDREGLTIPEGRICKIPASGKSTYVILRGKGDSMESAIWLDEKIRDTLGLDAGQDAEFEFQSVGLIGQVRWAWSASEPAYRVAARLAALSVFMGAIGLILGVLSLFVTLRGNR